MDKRAMKSVTIRLTDEQVNTVSDTLGVDCRSFTVNATDMVKLKERPPTSGKSQTNKLVLTPGQREMIRERLGDSFGSLSLEKDDIIILYGVPTDPDPDTGTA